MHKEGQDRATCTTCQIKNALRQYALKISGQRDRPVRVARRKLLVPPAMSLAGSVIGIAAIGFVASHFSLPLLLAPFGASAVLLFSVYDSPLSQPRNMLFGHVLSALIGGMIALVHVTLFGSIFATEKYLSIAIAVATAIFMMQVLGITHPPVGATAFIAATAVTDIESLTTLLIPVTAGALILIAVSIVFNNAVPNRRYPVYW